jgi:hypothetical protein
VAVPLRKAGVFSGVCPNVQLVEKINLEQVAGIILACDVLQNI